MKSFPAIRRALIVPVVLLPMLFGCAARQAQDSLAGATAQKLVSYSIDDLVRALPESDFAAWRGRSLYIRTHFVSDHEIQRYADRRLAVELARRFDIDVVYDPDGADAMLNVFYTSLATNRDTQGFFLPLGFVPGLEAETKINLLTLEQFQGVAEWYYFIGETGTEVRGKVMQARTRSDAIGLPIITIPLVTIDRD